MEAGKGVWLCQTDMQCVLIRCEFVVCAHKLVVGVDWTVSGYQLLGPILVCACVHACVGGCACVCVSISYLQTYHMWCVVLCQNIHVCTVVGPWWSCDGHVAALTTMCLDCCDCVGVNRIQCWSLLFSPHFHGT